METEKPEIQTWLVVWLGNEGDEYVRTRHNAAWIVSEKLSVESLPAQAGEKTLDKYLHGYTLSEVFTVHSSQITVLHLWPTTMMNLSGQSVSAIYKRYPQVTADHTIVVYDDVDIPVGQFQIAYGKGDGNHNGVKSIIATLDTRDFVRIRIGVGDNNRVMPLRGFVLGQLSDVEIESLQQIAPQIQEAIQMIVTEGLTKALNVYNKKS